MSSAEILGDAVVDDLEAEDGFLEGFGLESLQMVSFRGETAAYGENLAERRGAAWRGAPHNALRLRVYPKDAEVPLESQQKYLLKHGSLTVSERVK